MNKRLLGCGLIFLFMFILSKDAIIVRAAGCGGRTFGPVLPQDPKHPFGFGIEEATKTDPTNVIVWGQDIDKLGMDLSIKLISYPLTVNITESHEVGVQGQCAYLTQAEIEAEGAGNLTPCSGGRYRRKKIDTETGEPWCITVSWPEEVYRPIQQDSIKIWLSPSVDTRDWLGWNAVERSQDGNYPMRFVYPDSWVLTSWDSGGWIIEGDPLNIGGQDQLGGLGDTEYDYVKSDPTKIAIPSRTLHLAQDPIGILGYQETGLVLALYGSFSGFFPGTTGNPEEIGDTGACEYNFGKTDITGKGYPPRWDFGSSEDPICEKGGLTTHQVFTFHRIPMDLPGTWRIGVFFSVELATYQGVTIQSEKSIPAEDQYLYPFESGIEESDIRYPYDNYSFKSYILISVPCNDLEPGSCIK